MAENNITTPKPFVAAVAGPTASGKTGLAIGLAQRLVGEIVSCDSMQVYTGMQIATAAPTPGELAAAPHHLVQFLSPTTSFSVADYVPLAQNAIGDIAARGKLPILAGGTGLYMDSVLLGRSYNNVPNTDSYLPRWKEYLQANGANALYQVLCQRDTDLAKKLHPNNTGRVLRALCVMDATGKTMTQVQRETLQAQNPYPCAIVGIDYKDRQLLYNRINQRVDQMVQQGLLQEAEQYFAKYSGTKTAAQAMGYKELWPYFAGQRPLQDCLDTLKQQTRRYAKRQLTWFRANPRIHWLYADTATPNQLIDQAADYILKEAKAHEKVD